MDEESIAPNYSGLCLCQCQCVPKLSVSVVNFPSRSIIHWMKLALKRSMSGPTKRKLKKYSSQLIHRIKSFVKKDTSLDSGHAADHHMFLPGDLVRVRTEEEIRATLDVWNSLKGCGFLDGQRKYCNSFKKVLKTVDRFVDERDYKVKKARGVVLLEGSICEGAPYYGRCDRACFYFWREEWLELVDRKLLVEERDESHILESK